MKKLLIMLMMIIPLTSPSQNTNYNIKITKSLQELICSYLKENGCRYEIFNDNLMKFKYQGAQFVMLTDEEDPYYLQIIMPNVYEVDRNRRFVLEAINTIMKERKVLKAHIEKNRVWLSIEMFIDTTPEINIFFERCINILYQGRQLLYDEIAE